MKILVVDDEGIVLASCRKVLEAAGFDVIMAPSVDDAMQILGSRTEPPPQLLLIDVKMPVHNGLYLMQQVKQNWPALPIIVMSGYATAETIQSAEDFGAAVFIPKPFTPQELLDAVRSVAGKGTCHAYEKSIGH